MKTLLNVQRIRRVGIAAVLLAVASVSLSAGSAQARPKNACQNYIHMMDVTLGLENRALANVGYYLSIGDSQTASSYQAEALGRQVHQVRVLIPVTAGLARRRPRSSSPVAVASTAPSSSRTR